MKSKKALDFKQIEELTVFRGPHVAGTLKRTKAGSEFIFDSKFLGLQQYRGLSYTMPKQKDNYTYRGLNLPPFFAGLLPEGLRLKALVKAVKTSEDDMFTLLTAMGERTIGDVYIRSEGFPRPEPEVPRLDRINFYEFFNETLRVGLPSHGEEVFAGVQEKISASMISLPVKIAKKNRVYILKLDPKDKPHLTQNEYRCLLLAKKCGLEVNSASMVYDKHKNSGLLVERFDRIFNSGNAIQMVHQEDACQFLDLYPADKYRVSFREVCEGIQKYSTAPQIDLLKVLQVYIFSYLIGNGDLHAKNLSLQTDVQTGRVHLSPAYDLICTYVYKDRHMALKLDGRDHNFKRRHFLEFGERLNLKNEALQSMISKLLTRVQENQELLIAMPGLTSKMKHQLKKMVEDRTKALA